MPLIDDWNTGLAYVPFQEVALRLLSAAGLSFLLGLEREIHSKPYGLRTHMLLCIGTTAFTLIIMEMTMALSHLRDGEIEVDPARVVQAVVIGIGFMATGAMFRAKEQLVGATTGAGVWLLGSLGLACGLGLYVHALLLTGLVLFVVVLLYPLDKLLSKNDDDG